ncbi:MAG: hypothetical protein ACON5C_09470, partial [Alphaproteobacteria bacterium]
IFVEIHILNCQHKTLKANLMCEIRPKPKKGFDMTQTYSWTKHSFRMFLFVGLLILSGAFTAAKAAENTAGGKNTSWRQSQCTLQGETGYAYWLPNRKWNTSTTVVSVQWFSGNYTTSTGKLWERKSPGGVCELKAKVAGRSTTYTFFHDGCSGQAPGTPPTTTNGTNYVTWGRFFHAACVRHDHCYHHEPATNGRNQKTCDDHMKTAMDGFCDKRYRNSNTNQAVCRAASALMYTALRATNKFKANGSKHFQFENTSAPYPSLYMRK